MANINTRAYSSKTHHVVVSPIGIPVSPTETGKHGFLIFLEICQELISDKNIFSKTVPLNIVFF